MWLYSPFVSMTITWSPAVSGYHRRRHQSSQTDGSPPCVSGNIAIQWEWSNFDPSQNPNPLTNYD